MCIAVIVNRKYERYIPYFIFFVLRSYPKYTVKVLVTDTLSVEIKNIIAKLEVLGNIVVEEEFFKGFPNLNQELKTYRWLIPHSYFEDYEYVYIGDVDMLVCYESSGILEQHIDHIEKNDLPYSNCVRLNTKWFRPNTKRLSGLHFFKVKEYYSAMGDVIEDYTKKLRNGNLEKTKNEETLYKMIEEAGLKLPQDNLRIDHLGSGPHHGLHLGLWRKFYKINSTQEKQILKDSYEQHFEYFKELSNEDLFLYIEKLKPLDEIDNMKAYFNKILWKI